MLWNASKIVGCKIAALDGPLGTVEDFLFDDSGWRVRWLVVDTGHWLSGRKVLLPSLVLGPIDGEARTFSVRLTQEQIRNSPDIDSHQPVSRRMEAQIFDYYGWSPYWGGIDYLAAEGFAGGAIAAVPSVGARWRHDELAVLRDAEHWDRHLRSTAAVTGYHIATNDGDIGHVADFLIEDADWSLRFLIVDTQNWWPGKRVLISPQAVRSIDWATAVVTLSCSRERVKASPEYDPDAVIDWRQEQRWHHHFGSGQQENDRHP